MQKRLPHAAAAGLVAVALVLGGCGDDSDGGQPAPTQTTQTASSPPAPTRTSSPTPGETPSGPIPVYPGATVSSKSAGYTMLRSKDSVRTVGSFYVDALAKEGWETISKYQGEWSTHITAKRGNEGVTVQVSPSGGDSVISVSTYPL